MCCREGYVQLSLEKERIRGESDRSEIWVTNEPQIREELRRMALKIFFLIKK